MKKLHSILILIYIAFHFSCNSKPTYFSKPFFDSNNKYVGDSLFMDNLIKKIVFADTSYGIDSVVFVRYDNSARTVKAINTFKKGKVIFENVEYFDNGNIKKYSFIDEDNSHYFYERLYDINGKFTKSKGYVFFQGYLIDTVSSNIKVKKGTTIAYRIYYPNPPDCSTKIYITNKAGEKHDVFKKSNFLNFLQTVWQDNDEAGTYKTTVLLELIDKSTDTAIRYSRDIIFEVTP